jgi:nonsense-mediated mRNA decay protein 3
MTILVCRRCGAVKVPGGWRKITPPTSDPEEIIDREIAILLEQEVKVLAKGAELSYTEEKKLDRVMHILLAAIGKSHPSLSDHEETYPIEIRFNHGTCDSCAMMSGGYHEAILQVRADDRPLTEAEETEIMGLVTDMTESGYGKDTKAFVTEANRDRYGLDFKVGSEHLCRQIADKLESQYLAQRKENYKLIGQDRGGKRKYRITILIRLQRFSNGDFVKVEGIPCQIVSMGRGGLGCYDLSKGTSFTINQKSSKWRTLEFLAPASEKRQLMVVSNAYGQPVQLMDSETFDVHELDHEAIHIELVVGETIEALRVEDKILLLPSK